MVVLDSTFLTEYLKGKASAVERAESLLKEGHLLRVPAATWIEVLHAYPPRKRQALADVLERATVFVEMTRELADGAARLQHELRAEGAPLGWHDLQIAATALHFSEPLVSNDADFDAIAGIVRLDH